MNTFYDKGYYHVNTNFNFKFSKLNFFSVSDLVDGNSKMDEADTIEAYDLMDKMVELIQPIVHKPFIVTNYCAWEGVNLGSTFWHNDSIENFDFNALYYFDDTYEDIGGSIEFKFGEKEIKIFPKINDLILINQSGKFLHKASKSNKQRRVFNIECIFI